MSERDTKHYFGMIAFVLVVLLAITVVEANVNKRQQNRLDELNRRLEAIERQLEQRQ